MLLWCLLFLFSSCTYSVVVSGDCGSGTDSVSEEQEARGTVDPTVSIPGGL